jgi:soluble lytic murein transglycosylase-like protein
MMLATTRGMLRNGLVGTGLILYAATGLANVYACGSGDRLRFTDIRDDASCRLIIVSQPSRESRRGEKLTSAASAERGRWLPSVRAAAARHRLPPGLLESLVAVESGFRVDAVSSKGAIGLTQLMPGTARLLGVIDPFDPHANLDGGAQYLRMLLDLYGEDVTLALAAYNAGHAAVARHGNKVPPYPETRAYVTRIKSRWRDIQTRGAH